MLLVEILWEVTSPESQGTGDRRSTDTEGEWKSVSIPVRKSYLEQ